MTDWMDKAACRKPAVNPEWWWESYSLASHICRTHCPVRAKCDEWVYGQDMEGSVAGGYLRSDAKGSRANRQPTPHRGGCPRCAPNEAPPTTGKRGPATAGIVECPRCGRPTSLFVGGRLAVHHAGPNRRCR